MDEQQRTDFQARAASQKKANKAWVQKTKRKTPKDLDQQFQQAHEAVFARIDCLTCANCCQTLGPKFLEKDILRIARHLGLRPGHFTEKYLYLDEDGDYVLQSRPCPFLEADNRCAIYDIRPKACREYPHTDARNMRQRLQGTYLNSQTCPAVLEILALLRAESS